MKVDDRLSIVEVAFMIRSTVHNKDADCVELEERPCVELGDEVYLRVPVTRW